MKNLTKTPTNYVFVTDTYRLSFLDSCLFRLEKGSYLDEASQVIINRNIIKDFKIDVNELEDGLEFVTDEIKVYLNLKGEVSKIILLSNNQEVTDFKTSNLKGTARTLDGVNEGCPLNDGIMAKNGVAILDDSTSLVLFDNQILPREKTSDLYYFAYGNDYLKALKAFYHLTGNVPLIPKFALGNWWSRYHAYSDQEYLALIARFKKENIPISVSVIDMDWHYVDNYHEFKDDSLFTKKELNDDKIINEYYDGWTGYSFNKHLFKDYKKFLKQLKNENLKVTLNLHPNSGVRKYETMFTDMAKALNINPDTTRVIPFDITSQSFMKAYFEIIHHPYEQDGVDFWWIDWQQGVTSKMTGLDPLWALNHYHYLDNDRYNKRPLILSRFSGPGSHRYPLGFSGDTYMTWEALKFQPYFTATASNIGYVWWSHDIGGHMGGYKDDELYLRWLQLGVFSPINRLHSTCNEFTGKEPWKFVPETALIATKYLRLRKRLIPYLYSMNYQTYKNALPLVMPMYYKHHEEIAYHFDNEFYFGSELIVCPITSKTNKITKLASVVAYIPKGKWIDIFTNRIYQGPKIINLYRNINDIPVLAKSGAIIPLFIDSFTNNISSNQDLEINIYSGTNTFELYEDDGETKKYLDGEFSIRRISTVLKKNTLTLAISKNINALTDISYKRHLILAFKDVLKAKVIANVPYKKLKNDYLELKVLDDNQEIVITLENLKLLENKDFNEQVIDLVSTYQMDNYQKEVIFMPILKDSKAKLKGPKDLIGPIKELLKLK